MYRQYISLYDLIVVFILAKKFVWTFSGYEESVPNNWEDWEVTGNNLFIKILSDDIANTLRCEKGVNVKNQVMSVT